MLKIVIGTNEGKVLCISNNEDEIKASMVNYLIDTDQEPTEDFFESRNWGEYDIEVYEYHQPQLNENQQIVLKHLKSMCPPKLGLSAMVTVYCLVDDNINDNWQEYSEEIPEHIEALQKLSVAEESQVLAAFAQWGLEQEEAG
ncbi:hypothetical protein QJS77_07300 [Enterococcus faecium]|uniref:hypothetical protein n=1 Tax=Enterococcus faecium TaxID=1352 RepID=UPI00396EA8B3